MAFKPDPVQPDFSSLITSLDNSKTQKSNYSLYQTIFLLIKLVTRSQGLFVDDIDKLNQQLAEIFAATFLTVDDESTDFPNSRQLLAGTNISFDDTIAHQRTINATGGGTGNYYDSPLTDGDLDETDLIFANADPIIVQIPNVP